MNPTTVAPIPIYIFDSHSEKDTIPDTLVYYNGISSSGDFRMDASIDYNTAILTVGSFSMFIIILLILRYVK